MASIQSQSRRPCLVGSLSVVNYDIKIFEVCVPNLLVLGLVEVIFVEDECAGEDVS